MADDLISRQATLEKFKKTYFDDRTVIRCAELVLGGMPSVQPQQRTGYWIMHFDEISPSDSTMECSECGEELTVMYVKGDYCPNCGSKNKVKHGDKKK